MVDKHYQSQYVSYTYSKVGDSYIMIPITHPESYKFTIKGEKDGETVEYTFSVTEDEYSQYSIGDYYKH